VELIDDDGGTAHGSAPQAATGSEANSNAYAANNNGMMWYDQPGLATLPWDLQNDVYSVFITALPAVPKDLQGPGKSLPTTEWHQKCFAIAYRYANYIGWLLKMISTSTSGTYYDKSVNVESVQISPGCAKVILYDDDWSGSANNAHLTSSWSYLNYDLRRDVKGYKLYRKSNVPGAAMFSKLSTSLDEQAAQLKEQAQEQHEEQHDHVGSIENVHTLNHKLFHIKEQKPADSGCWTCHSSEGEVNEGKCWRGAKTADSCTGDTLTDIDCRCVEGKERIARETAEETNKDVDAMCAQCGYPHKSNANKFNTCKQTCNASKKKVGDEYTATCPTDCNEAPTEETTAAEASAFAGAFNDDTVQD